MAQLIVRNLDEEIVKRLRRRAAESGRSVEAEPSSSIVRPSAWNAAGCSWNKSAGAIPVQSMW